MSAAEAAVPVSEAQLAKAIAAILKHLATEHRKHNELFGEAEYLYLVRERLPSWLPLSAQRLITH